MLPKRFENAETRVSSNFVIALRGGRIFPFCIFFREQKPEMIMIGASEKGDFCVLYQ